ncbi:MAG: SDR family oxidoreductase, partial [Planctomycetes bacterium]|nr:SDR family oxidoreductase [Planctomycetota bacterium]
LSVYAATKAALEGFCICLARELGPRGIRVNALAPGFLDTDLSASLAMENRERISRRLAMQRLGTTADVAGVVSTVSGSGMSFVTSQVVGVDGGS